jgi:GTP-binding protein EngB required for normal cell division
MAASLNDNQKRRLLLTFEHVDNLLADALQALVSAEAPSPFQRYIPDSLPVQRKVIADYISRLRGMMVRILESDGIAVPKPQVSSLWSFQATLLSAKVAVEGLAPKYMRGYGDLPDDAAHKLEVLTTQIMDVLERMSSYLARGAGQDLQARLERLEKITHEVEWARLIEQAVTTHGLIELRPSLDAVIERLESSRFEVAVFGRVSSGKSSLLDHILRTDVLPVGVTPVTAIPTRVVFGSRPLARIWFAEAGPIAVEPHELAQYVTEQGNPDNAKHVTRIQVELPTDRLAEGVTFVDTPGLGSLARYGQMESLAYLPRCDLGIVLVDTSSTLIQEDASIVSALRQAGAEVMVLLTKADVLALGERPAAVQYVKDQLRANLGFDVPVHIVSVKGPDAELCDRWFETALVPCLREHRKLAGASLRRKVGLLREATIAALQRRLDKRSAVSEDMTGQWATVEPVLNEVLVKLEAAMRERLEWPGVSEKIVDVAAREMVDEWRRDGTTQIDPASKLISCGSNHVSLLVDEVAKSLALLLENLGGALRRAGAAAGARQEDAAELPALAGMPILDLAASLGSPNTVNGVWGPLPETPWRRPRLALLLRELTCRITRKQLARQFGPRLTRQLEQYARQVDQWRSETLAQLRRAFTAKADFYRVQCGQTPDNSDLAAIERDLKRLQALRGD